MLGSEAPVVPTHTVFAQPQVAAHPAVLQPPIAALPAQVQQAAAAVPAQHAVEKDTDRDSSGLVLPLARVKRIIKSEGDVKAVSSEASFAVARAAELLLEELARRANSQMQSQHRSTLQYKDVAAVVHDWKSLAFLSDIVPQQVAVSTLLEKYRQQHPELVHVPPPPQVQPQANGVANTGFGGINQASMQQLHTVQQPAPGKSTLQQPVASNLLLLQQQQQQQRQQQQAQQQLQQQQVQQQGQAQPVRPVYAQPRSQQLPHSQLAQLVQPRMQHFPVAEQVQQLLPAMQAVSGTNPSYAAQRPAAQHQLLAQHQQVPQQSQASAQQPPSGQLTQPTLSGHLQALTQQQLAAQLQSVQQQLTAQQHQQQQQQAPLLQQLQQQQQRVSQPLAQHPSVVQYLQQHMLQPQHQQQHQQQAQQQHQQQPQQQHQQQQPQQQQPQPQAQQHQQQQLQQQPLGP